jgi:hypothetical protein
VGLLTPLAPQPGKGHPQQGSQRSSLHPGAYSVLLTRSSSVLSRITNPLFLSSTSRISATDIHPFLGQHSSLSPHIRCWRLMKNSFYGPVTSGVYDITVTHICTYLPGHTCVQNRTMGHHIYSTVAELGPLSLSHQGCSTRRTVWCEKKCSACIEYITVPLEHRKVVFSCYY